MSKYTTEVRFICESKAEYDSSVGYTSVDDVISKSWNKIFTSNVKFFDSDYKKILCSKILKHYYLREICCETVGIWLLWMNSRLEEIMPYYNQLYESAQIKFEPLVDVNITRTHLKENSGTENVSSSTENSSRVSEKTSDTTTSDNTHRDLFSDTPQGSITGLENEKYLTNARKITDNDTDTSTGESTNAAESNGKYGEDRTRSENETLTESTVGKQGSTSYSKLLIEYRETFLNIDNQVIDEFSDLFFGLY